MQTVHFTSDMQDAKQQLMVKIKDTDEMMEDLDGCINDLETGTEETGFFVV